MKTKTGFLLIFSLYILNCYSQNLDSVRQVIQNMKFEAPVLMPKPSAVDKVQNPVISLNGTWKFSVTDDKTVQSKNIEVPGEWEMQGFKVEKGMSVIYSKTFVLPEDWKGNNVRIRFDGVSSWCSVKVNGKPVGEHEGSFVMFEFDVTNAIKPGKNTLEVEVQSQTISDILACTSQYAAHTVGGILRKVTLFALPPTHIADFAWSVKFDKQYHDASLNIACKVQSDNNSGNGL